MRKVHTTFEPDVELEVSEEEYTDLNRQGLLVEEVDINSTPVQVSERKSKNGESA